MLVVARFLQPRRDRRDAALDPVVGVSGLGHLLEDLERARDRADFVAARLAGHLERQVAGGQALHQGGELGQRPRHLPARDGDRQQAEEGAAAEHGEQDQPGDARGLGDRRVVVPQLLVAGALDRAEHAARLVDGAAVLAAGDHGDGLRPGRAVLHPAEDRVGDASPVAVHQRRDLVEARQLLRVAAHLLAQAPQQHQQLVAPTVVRVEEFVVDGDHVAAQRELLVHHRARQAVHADEQLVGGDAGLARA